MQPTLRLPAAGMYEQQWNSNASRSDDKLGKVVRDPLLTMSRWIKQRSQQEKMAMAVAGGILVTLQQEIQCLAVAVANQRPLPPQRRGTHNAVTWYDHTPRTALKHQNVVLSMPEVHGSYSRSWCLVASTMGARKSVQLFPKLCLAAFAKSLPCCSATSAGYGCPAQLKLG